MFFDYMLWFCIYTYLPCLVLLVGQYSHLWYLNNPAVFTIKASLNEACEKILRVLIKTEGVKQVLLLPNKVKLKVGCFSNRNPLENIIQKKAKHIYNEKINGFLVFVLKWDVNNLKSNNWQLSHAKSL